MNALLAWLFWNPSRVAFTVPYIDRPVAWYGLFFVFGFFIGYILVTHIIRRKIWEINKIRERDISSWTQLIKEIKQNERVQKFLSKEYRQELQELSLHQEPTHQLKRSLLKSLNLYLQDPESHCSRKKLEDIFPKSIEKAKDLANILTERMTWFIVAGTIIGSRLGHVFFYEWPRYRNHLGDIFKIWEGGLASHGGAIGVILALFLFRKTIQKSFPELTMVTLMDIVSIPTAFVAVCIRLGNFVNQEIIGPASNAPWAIIFGDPIDGGPAIPRHPTQLYEAICYLGTFLFLWALWYKKSDKLKPGMIAGLFFICVFGSRFILEFLKMPMSLMIDESFLQTGQILSIPFIFAGALLFRYGSKLNYTMQE